MPSQPEAERRSPQSANLSDFLAEVRQSRLAATAQRIFAEPDPQAGEAGKPCESEAHGPTRQPAANGSCTIPIRILVR